MRKCIRHIKILNSFKSQNQSFPTSLLTNFLFSHKESFPYGINSTPLSDKTLMKLSIKNKNSTWTLSNKDIKTISFRIRSKYNLDKITLFQDMMTVVIHISNMQKSKIKKESPWVMFGPDNS